MQQPIANFANLPMPGSLPSGGAAASLDAISPQMFAEALATALRQAFGGAGDIAGRALFLQSAMAGLSGAGGASGAILAMPTLPTTPVFPAELLQQIDATANTLLGDIDAVLTGDVVLSPVELDSFKAELDRLLDSIRLEELSEPADDLEEALIPEITGELDLGTALTPDALATATPSPTSPQTLAAIPLVAALPGSLPPKPDHATFSQASVGATSSRPSFFGTGTQHVPESAIEAPQIPVIDNKPTLPISLLPKSTRIKPLSVPSERIDRVEAPSPTQVESSFQANSSVKTEVAPAPSTADQNAAVLARIDRVEFVERVTQALRQASVQSPKEITLELNPPSLGRMTIQVGHENGELVARIQAQSPAARAALLEQMPMLERNLGQHGVQIQRFNVDELPTASASAGQQDGRGQAQDQQSRQQEQLWQQPRAFGHRPANADGKRTPLTIGDVLAYAPGMNRVI